MKTVMNQMMRNANAMKNKAILFTAIAMGVLWAIQVITICTHPYFF